MDEIRLKPRAKINLCLDVVGKRDNGYHELKMIMQTVSLHDKLLMKKTGNNKIELKVNLPFLPTDNRNLVYKVVEDIRSTYGIRDGVCIDLFKVIPVGAGLGGGSADAAGAIRGMDRLFGLNMTQEEMAAIGLKYGADIPFCLMGGTALAEGVGEILTPLPDMPEIFVLIVKPEESAATAKIFGKFDLNVLESHPDADGMAMAVASGDIDGILDRMGNVLEPTTISEYASVGKLKEMLLQAGADNAMMTGSGTAVFGLFKDEAVMKQAAVKIKETGLARMVFESRTEKQKVGH